MRNYKIINKLLRNRKIMRSKDGVGLKENLNKYFLSGDKVSCLKVHFPSRFIPVVDNYFL